MASDDSNAATSGGKPDLLAVVDHILISPSPSGSRLTITATVSLELDDVNALDMTLKLVDALVRMRGSDQ